MRQIWMLVAALIVVASDAEAARVQRLTYQIHRVATAVAYPQEGTVTGFSHNVSDQEGNKIHCWFSDTGARSANAKEFINTNMDAMTRHLRPLASPLNWPKELKSTGLAGCPAKGTRGKVIRWEVRIEVVTRPSHPNFSGTLITFPAPAPNVAASISAAKTAIEAKNKQFAEHLRNPQPIGG